MIKIFYEWLTYNPMNVPLKEIVIPIILMWFILAVVFLLLFYAVVRKVTLKVCVASLLFASPYFMFTFFWQICFLDASVFVCLFPIYPLAVLVLVLLVYKNMKRRKILVGAGK